MADDSHLDGHDHPRHAAEPWWLSEPEAAEDTRVIPRLDAEPTARPRRGASEDPDPHTGHHTPDKTTPPSTRTARDGVADPSSAAMTSARTAGTTDHQRDRAFRRSLLWTFLGALVPGLGLSRSASRSRRIAGWVLVGLTAAALVVLVVMALSDTSLVASVVVRPTMLTALIWALPTLAVVLVGLLVVTNLDLRPRVLTTGQRWLSALLVGALSLGIATPMAVGARYAHDESALLDKIFRNSLSGTRPDIDTSRSVQEIWASKKRVNVLLVGADDSNSRNYRSKGEMNTDTIMVASIDTQTADTTIIQIPRNTAAMPFPADSKLHQIYPNGFTNGHGDDSASWANAIWSTVESEHKDAMGATDYPGADALKLAVGEALGLKLDYFVMIDIDGLQRLVDALGGVTVNVNERIPIAGNTEGKAPTGYIEIGASQHLDGYRAMWYARSRSATTDYDRMGRQSCLMKAVLDQASPQVVLTRFESIADASGQMVVSDIPQGMLPAFVDLAIRMRNANLNRLLFTIGKNGFKPYAPDYALMRKQVAQAIAEASDADNKNKPVTGASAVKVSTTPSASSTPSATARASATAKASTSASPTPTKQSQSITDECAYNPQK